MTKLLAKVVLVVVLGLLALAAFMQSGCATLPPNTSPEGATAIRATQVVAALRATLPGIKALTCTSATLPSALPTCLPPAEAIRVVSRIEDAGELAGHLALALQAVDEAKDATARTEGLAKVSALVQSIQQTISLATIAPSAEPARAAVLQVLAGVTSILLTLGGL